MGNFYTLLFLRSAKLSKAFGLCYSKISIVILIGYRLLESRKNSESERKIYALRTNTAYLKS